MKDIKIILLILLIVGVYIFINKQKEGLSVSQFPETPTCKTCDFYTCDKKNWMQIQNLEDGDYSCKRTNAFCNVPIKWQNFMKQRREEFKMTSNSKASNEYNLPVLNLSMDLVQYGLKHQLTMTHIEDILTKNQTLLVSWNEQSLYTLLFQLLIENIYPNKSGYPDLYYIGGPILVLQNDGNDTIHYMIDYPQKYTPSKWSNFVNVTNNPMELKFIIERALRLIPDNAIFVVLE